MYVPYYFPLPKTVSISHNNGLKKVINKMIYVHNILDNIFTFILITNESFVVFLGIGRADVIVTYSVKITDFLLSN